MKSVKITYEFLIEKTDNESCQRKVVTLYNERSSKEERRVDALALRAEERRDKLRKATGRSKYP